jgi:hypothetical protein
MRVRRRVSRRIFGPKKDGSVSMETGCGLYVWPTNQDLIVCFAKCLGMLWSLTTTHLVGEDSSLRLDCDTGHTAPSAETKIACSCTLPVSPNVPVSGRELSTGTTLLSLFDGDKWGHSFGHWACGMGADSKIKEATMGETRYWLLARMFIGLPLSGKEIDVRTTLKWIISC